MTYKELINTIEVICVNNFFCESFDSGNLSDINIGDETKKVLYPHAFLIPNTLTSTKQSTNFGFQLVMMTYCEEDDILTTQSEQIETLYNFISVFNEYNFDWKISDSYTITPFKEFYKDRVAGATLSISIKLPKPLDKCNLPSV